MQAVDLDARLIDQLRQPGLRIEAHPVHQGRSGSTVRVRVLDGRDLLVPQVLVKAPAQGDVEQLLAAADPERRQVIVESPARQRQLGPVTFGLDDIQIIDWLFAIFLRRHIGTARKHDAVEALVDGAQPSLIVE